ncbi:hypothetical protein BLA14095_01375 [Burkholderia lata]|uniref:hypothetical protein n=1 Tax=Burkholderia lata (strain ATCC 17760 / DSM 23089 / LMG 22485 / NCIMB 9086 / R18194 / 383) TaxID=482957 RepID=UPI001452E8CC|nr:hypothetical protein [Burkholderia lata]VWB34491.1 hypothetical protein BLA14095_01375 [Burkholderia lata]
MQKLTNTHDRRALSTVVRIAYMVAVLATAPRSGITQYPLALMMLGHGGLLVYAPFYAMLGVASMQAADVLTNVILRGRFVCVWLADMRRGLYVYAAFCYLVPPFVLAPVLGDAWGAYVVSVAMAVVSLAMAFHDLFEKRHRRAVCKT